MADGIGLPFFHTYARITRKIGTSSICFVSAIIKQACEMPLKLFAFERKCLGWREVGKAGAEQRDFSSLSQIRNAYCSTKPIAVDAFTPRAGNSRQSGIQWRENMSAVIDRPAASNPDSFEEKMRQLLLSSGISDFRDVLVACDESVISIDGAVTSHYHKQLAQALLMPMAGEDRKFVNRLKVISSRRPPMPRDPAC
ncbi:MAG: hypothetical protein U1D30_09825 [Planctomycetota bacterium]